MITVRYFAGFKEWTGKNQEQLPFSDINVQDLLNWVREHYEGVSNDPVHVAVNEEYALPEQRIVSGDVVALIPPVSGG